MTPAAPSSIAVRGLAFTYPDGQRALDGLAFDIAPGEAVGLVGANGAGKSTLLLLLAGCLVPSAGSIELDGFALDRAHLPRARRRAGLLFQDPDDQLFMPTVFDDVAFGPLNQGCQREDVEQRVTRALAETGSSHLRKRPPYHLSGGEKRLVALAAVLACEPAILVMDEPSSNLDPRARRRLIRWLQQSNRTRLVATHDLELVVETCSRVLVLDQGQLVASGPVHEVLGESALMERHGLETPHILLHRHPHP